VLVEVEAFCLGEAAELKFWEKEVAGPADEDGAGAGLVSEPDIDSEVHEDEDEAEVQTELVLETDTVEMADDDSEPAEVMVEEVSGIQRSRHETLPTRIKTHHPIHLPDGCTIRGCRLE
jgi:hypothetical protein